MSFRPFSNIDSYTAFRSHLEQTLAEIDALGNEYVLRCSITELENYFVDSLCSRLASNASSSRIVMGRHQPSRRSTRRASRGGLRSTAGGVPIPRRKRGPPYVAGILWSWRVHVYVDQLASSRSHREFFLNLEVDRTHHGNSIRSELRANVSTTSNPLLRHVGRVRRSRCQKGKASVIALSQEPGIIVVV